MSPEVRRIPVLPAGTCPAGCRPLALVEEGRLLGLAGDPPGGPCPWCLEAFREERAPGRSRGPLLPRAGRRIPGGGHEMERGRPAEAIDRLAGAIAGRAERILWIEPETLPLELAALPHRVARLGIPVHLFRVPRAPWHLARRFAELVPRDRLVPLEGASPGPGDLVLAWDPDPAGGWAREETWLAEARSRGAVVASVGPLAASGEEGDGIRLGLPPGWEGALALALGTPRGEPVPGGWSLRRIAAEAGLDTATLERLAELVDAAGSRCFLLPGSPVAAWPGETLAALASLARRRDFRVVVAPPPPPREFLLPGEGRVVGVAPGKFPDLLGSLPAARTLVVVVGIDPLAGAPGAGELGRFLDAAGLVVVFGPREGPVTRRADLVLPGAGTPSRGGTSWTTRGAWRGLSPAPAAGDAGDLAATWRAVGRRLRAPEGLFPPGGGRADGEGGEGFVLPPCRPDPPDPAWHPDPDLVAGSPGLVFLGRRFLPRPGWEIPVVRLAPASAEERDLAPGSLARARAREGELLVRVETDGSVPPGLVVYGSPDAPGRPGPGILAPPPYLLGAVRPFRGDLFPATGGPGPGKS